MDTRFTVLIAFTLGACASAAATSVASDDPRVQPDASASASTSAQVEGPRLVVAAGEAEHRRAPSGAAEVFVLARGANAFVARLELAADGAVPEHRDATEEFLYVLEGEGELRIEDDPYPIAPGTSIYMPANAKVSYQNGPARLVALQVFAGPGPAAKYDAWTLVEGASD